MAVNDADSREKLEADVYRAAEEMEEFTHGEKFINTNKILRWLDRQAAITRAEVFEDGEFDCLTCDAKRELQDRMAELEADRDRLGKSCWKLESELAEKKQVCDVQRESFRKMERDLADANERIGELERTIENMRGD